MQSGAGQVKRGAAACLLHRCCGANRSPLVCRFVLERPMILVLTIINALFNLTFWFLRLYVWAIILGAVFSMLVGFGVLDTRNRLVWSIGDFLYRVTEPALRPIRRFLPVFGSIDLSPLVAIAVIELVVFPVLAAVQDGIVFGHW
jgi:YggT family protein